MNRYHFRDLHCVDSPNVLYKVTIIILRLYKIKIGLQLQYHLTGWWDVPPRLTEPLNISDHTLCNGCLLLNVYRQWIQVKFIDINLIYDYFFLPLFMTWVFKRWSRSGIPRGSSEILLGGYRSLCDYIYTHLKVGLASLFWTGGNISWNRPIYKLTTHRRCVVSSVGEIGVMLSIGLQQKLLL